MVRRQLSRPMDYQLSDMGFPLALSETVLSEKVLSEKAYQRGFIKKVLSEKFYQKNIFRKVYCFSISVIRKIYYISLLVFRKVYDISFQKLDFRIVFSIDFRTVFRK
ncbi:hypothetical protein ACOSQ3_005431 [Xanthoceras sorbifolium]